MKRKDENVIIEYPFSVKWRNIFQEFCEKYQYDVITIYAMVEDFDENWDRIIKRDFSDERHPAHERSEYNPLYKNQYEKVENMDYYKLKEEWRGRKYHQINLGKVIEFYNENHQSLEQMRKKIEE